MTWPDFVNIARIRAVEEAEEQGRVWDAEMRFQATCQAAKAVGRDAPRLLTRRAALLMKEAVDHDALDTL